MSDVLLAPETANALAKLPTQSDYKLQSGGLTDSKSPQVENLDSDQRTYAERPGLARKDLSTTPKQIAFSAIVDADDVYDFGPQLEKFSPAERAVAVYSLLYGEPTSLLLENDTKNLKLTPEVFVDSPSYDPKAKSAFNAELNSILGSTDFKEAPRESYARMILNYVSIRDNQVPLAAESNPTLWAIQSAIEIRNALVEPRTAPLQTLDQRTLTNNEIPHSEPVLSPSPSSPPKPDALEPSSVQALIKISATPPVEQPVKPEVSALPNAAINPAPIETKVTTATNTTGSTNLASPLPKATDGPTTVASNVEPNREELTQQIYRALYGQAFAEKVASCVKLLPAINDSILEGHPAYNPAAALEFEAATERLCRQVPDLSPSQLINAKAISEGYAPGSLEPTRWGKDQAVEIFNADGRPKVSAREAMRLDPDLRTSSIQSDVPTAKQLSSADQANQTEGQTQQLAATADREPRHRWWKFWSRSERYENSKPIEEARNSVSIESTVTTEEPSHGSHRLLQRQLKGAEKLNQLSQRARN